MHACLNVVCTVYNTVYNTLELLLLYLDLQQWLELVQPNQCHQLAPPFLIIYCTSHFYRNRPQ